MQILGIPLKSANQRFTLYKLIVMPQQVSKVKFIKYLPEFSYFGLSVSGEKISFGHQRI
jgi:predicted ester cyclase